jgi:hypothetical protein
MVEFVVQGDRMPEHLARFNNDGRYKHISRQQWLLVDFTNSEPNKYLDHPNVARIHYSVDYKQLTVYYNKNVTTIHPIGDQPSLVLSQSLDVSDTSASTEDECAKRKELDSPDAHDTPIKKHKD